MSTEHGEAKGTTTTSMEDVKITTDEGDAKDANTVEKPKPTQPKQIGQKFSTGVATEMGGASCIVNGQYVYFIGGTGLAVIDVSDPAKPRKVTEVLTGVATYSGGGHLAQSGTHLFVVGGHGMAVFDVEKPGTWLRSSHPPLARSLPLLSDRKEERASRHGTQKRQRRSKKWTLES